jgi:hypothetical protein
MLEFEIEQVVEIKELGQFIFAKQIEPGANFSVNAGTHLGDIKLEEDLDIPRALDQNGVQRNNLFVFKPRYRVDTVQLDKGMVGKLSTLK